MRNPLQILWYIRAIDGRIPWRKDGRFPLDHHRLRRLASTLDRAGYYGALTTATNKHDAFFQALSLIPYSERLRFLVPIYPGVIPPALLAEQALTFDDYSGGRLLFNQVNGDDPHLNRYGPQPSHDERYEVSAEYWSLFKRVYSGDLSAHKGKYFSYSAAHPGRIDEPPGAIQLPHTPLWGSGASKAGIHHAGKVLDTYLTFLQRPDKLRSQIEAARAVAAEHGRTLRVGTLGSVIVRESEEEAWAHAHWLVERTGVEAIVKFINARLGHFDRGALAEISSPDPQVQRRIDALRAGKLPTREDLEVYPNIWSGMTTWTSIDVFDKGWGTYIVGNPKQVAARIHELQDTLGIDTFILSGWPLIEEAERTAELLFPHLNLDRSLPILAS